MGLLLTGLAGSLLGGFSRDRAAARAEDAVIASISQQDASNIARRNDDIREARAEFAADQGRMTAYAREDEARARASAAADLHDARVAAQNDEHRARLAAQADEGRFRAIQGIDFERLVDDAQKAGFNPLTALLAGGSSAYMRQDAIRDTPTMTTPTASMPVISTPFVPFAQAWSPRPLLDLSGQMSAQVQRPQFKGYVGDSIGSFAQTAIGLSLEHARLKNDAELASAMSGGVRRVPSVPPSINRADARPLEATVGSVFSRLPMPNPGSMVPGTSLGFDDFGYSTFRTSDLADRPEEVMPVQNVPWFKKGNLMGRNVYVWNDEFADNELASMVSVAGAFAQRAIIARDELIDWAVERATQPVNNREQYDAATMWGAM